jgi:hypothetical protein
MPLASPSRSSSEPPARPFPPGGRDYRGSDGRSCAIAAIRALAACTFKTRAFTDFALCKSSHPRGMAVAGYGDPKAADFPLKLAPGYIGIG